jgi:hypothetical protein
VLSGHGPKVTCRLTIPEDGQVRTLPHGKKEPGQAAAAAALRAVVRATAYAWFGRFG